MSKSAFADTPATSNPATSARNALRQGVLRKLRLVFSSAKKHFRAVETATGMSGAQLWALIEIRDHPASSVSDIAARLSVHMSTASNLLEKLEANALITRTRNNKDRRIVHIHLTPKGRRILAKAPGPARGVVPDALMRLPTARLKSLDRDLEALVSHMARRDRRGSVTPLSDI
jgi:DNA-binding MarR family transcriptional regulator